MALPTQATNTIYQGGGPVGPGGQGGYTLENRYVASEAITPGHLIEAVDDSGTPKYRKHATSTGHAIPTFALEQGEFFLSGGAVAALAEDYASGDLVKAATMFPGSKLLAWVGSGENIVAGDLLASAGDGTLTESTTNSIARAVGNTGGAVIVPTRVVVEVI